ncbi:phosphatidylethanolamine-binding protein [Colletotrichum higginsianum IMI 349063]|uniref:Large ribosomal subunit protein mL38 n=3 Tax=Colletotrichum higginsianum TaxID=80884 RepID=A0A1B7YGK6_COLHI|nr:phosphatidylethanolamine-binding protein [Colletotrichum higginsianum IMI 349063]OBR10938.1 phosphatidylethanolamine-binding protein [Colletotrichum higginsianum IMI 349063]TID07798.1 54S ribosomal protein L35, mitochondrial [Colletotrichum higginsianum]
MSSSCRQAIRPLRRCLNNSIATPLPIRRSLSTTPAPAAEVYKVSRERPETVDPVELNPNTAVAPWAEKDLWKAGTPPIGSRRRRYAIRTSANLPFEQLPYQAFQEARKILAADRQEKLQAIIAEMQKIKRLEGIKGDNVRGGEKMRQRKLASMRQHVERLKILADINDPAVKRRFEDGLGDMNKPIYRFLAERKWRAYEAKMIEQRIAQFNIVPDILPKLEPTYDVQLFFRRAKVPPGKVLPSNVTEVPPRLRVTPFTAGERLVSIVVMDSDVPSVNTDSFSKRCHFLAANVPVSPTTTSVPLSKIRDPSQLAVPYLPAFSQKGAPYHRLSVFILEQAPGKILNAAVLKDLYSARDGFSLKSFRDKFQLKPVGFNLFRTIWDENTAGVMERAGMPGADVEFRPTRVYSLKEPKTPRGWEAKRQGPKYKHLWKYTKRIKGYSNAKGLVRR